MSTTGQTYYKAARDEVIVRIRLRDQILLSYIISAGAVLGVSVGNIGGLAGTVALIVPFLGLGAAILVSSHSIMITNIGRYTKELHPGITECRKLHFEVDCKNSGLVNKDMIELVPWDWSNEFMRHGAQSSKYRLIGHFLIILIPSFFSLFVGLEEFKFPFSFPDDVHSVLWVAGLVLVGVSAWYLIKAHFIRYQSLQ